MSYSSLVGPAAGLGWRRLGQQRFRSL